MKKAVAVVIVLVLLCGLSLDNTYSQKATATPDYPATIEALQKQLTPSATPAKSPTPKATATPLGYVSEHEYLQGLRTDFKKFSDALIEMGNLDYTEWKRHPDLFQVWVDLNAKYRAITPPTIYRDLHHDWEEILGKLAPGARSLSKGENPDLDEINFMQEGIDLITDFAIKLDDTLISAGLEPLFQGSESSTTSSSGVSLSVSGTSDVSRSFTLSEGSHEVSHRCTGSNYAVFLTMETAPGESEFVYEILSLGEAAPTSGTNLVRFDETSRVVIVLDTVGGSTTCTVTID